MAERPSLSPQALGSELEDLAECVLDLGTAHPREARIHEYGVRLREKVATGARSARADERACRGAAGILAASPHSHIRQAPQAASGQVRRQAPIPHEGSPS
jgi:hypothetical protein